MLFALLAAGFLLPAAATGQGTTPTVQETQSFTLTVPAPPASAAAPAAPAPAPVALPNRSTAEPATGPLPRRLAYTGSDPLPIIAGGLALVALSLFARRWARARLRARRA